MAESDNKSNREEIFSRTVRAGKRTYFFDVKSTRSNENYLVLTESKRRFNNEQGKFYYEKHKVFLYREDFEKFARGLREAIEFIETGKKPDDYDEAPASENLENVEKAEEISEEPESKAHEEIDFEDLGEEGKSDAGEENEEEKK